MGNLKFRVCKEYKDNNYQYFVEKKVLCFWIKLGKVGFPVTNCTWSKGLIGMYRRFMTLEDCQEFIQEIVEFKKKKKKEKKKNEYFYYEAK